MTVVMIATVTVKLSFPSSTLLFQPSLSPLSGVLPDGPSILYFAHVTSTPRVTRKPVYVIAEIAFYQMLQEQE